MNKLEHILLDIKVRLTNLGLATAGFTRWASGGGWRRCNLCESRVSNFLPYRGGWKAAPLLMRVLGMVGSDLDNFLCPRCGSSDRERHLKMYFESTAILDLLRGGRVLHFAPENQLSRWIKSLGPALYIKADLFPVSPDIRKVDLLDIPFGDTEFDIVIANHVLEHVSDDMRALKELQRVLKPGGFAVLQTPYCRGLSDVVEDCMVVSADARRELYGQEDHVRLYGAGIYDRFKSSGLISESKTHQELLPHIDPVTVGVNRDEPFMCFRKN